MIVEGTVESFDVGRGDGVILSDAGERLGFHCVALLDGTRQVAPGTRVRAQRIVGQRGRDELGSIETI